VLSKLKRVKSSPRRATFATVSTGLLAAAAVLLIAAIFPTVWEYLDAITSDFEVYYLRPSRPTGNVVIAAIDDASIAKFGRWPWSRNIQSLILEKLGHYHASVIGFDMVFSEPESPASDSGLAQAMDKYKPIYIGYFFNTTLTSADEAVNIYKRVLRDPPPSSYSLVRKATASVLEPPSAVAYFPPIPQLNRASAGAAYLNIDEDVDGAVRSYPTVIRFDDLYCVPFFLELADSYLGHPPLSITLTANGVAEVLAGSRPIPVDESGKTALRYRGPAGTMPRYSVASIIAERVSSRALEKKIVVVGVTAVGLGDRFATPAGSDFPGVEIQATAVDNVLAGDFIRHPWTARLEEAILSLAVSIVFTLGLASTTAIFGPPLMFIVAAACFCYSLLRLSHDNTLVSIALPWSTLAVTYLAVVSYRYVSEGRQKRYLRSVFELYLNREIIASIVSNPAALKLGGQRQHLSILFADIVDFTSRAESTDPEKLVSLLNTYMTVMTNVILKHGGVVDKLMGDGIMAFWGAPAQSSNPARQAIECALEMLGQLRLLAQRDGRFDDVEIGIGIATGEAIVGNMGGENRFDYSAVGDKVNLAARLEGLTRVFGARILTEGRTLEESGGGFVTREIGLVRVKGKQQLVRLVEIGNDADAAYYSRFAHAVGMLRLSKSPVAELCQLLVERPQDRVAAMWLERLGAEASDAREMTFSFDLK
jgi:adenylate cyclase